MMHWSDKEQKWEGDFHCIPFYIFILKNHRNVLPKKTFLKTYTSELGKVFKDI